MCALTGPSPHTPHAPRRLHSPLPRPTRPTGTITGHTDGTHHTHTTARACRIPSANQSIRGVNKRRFILYCIHTVRTMLAPCRRRPERVCGAIKKNKSVQSGIEPWKSPYRNPPVVWWARSRLRRGAEAIIKAGVELLCSRPGLRYSVY